MGKPTQPKRYVIRAGRKTGIFSSRDDVKPLVDGYQGAQYKSYPSRADAEHAFAGPYAAALVAKPSRNASRSWPRKLPAIAVDAACSGNPGTLERQGVNMLTGELVFQRWPFPDGTVNIGEFLAIVDAMKFLSTQARPYRVIYSDSRTWRARVRDGAINTTLPYTGHNDALFALVDDAISRLSTQDMSQWDIRVRDTNSRWEIPADFWRK